MSSSAEKIFIQIASYRDPQLISTVRHAISQAKDSSRLVFGICRQFSEKETFDDDIEKAFPNDSRFRVLNIPYEKSTGACWARNQIQELLYKDEPYTLQLDSHMRFVQHWDDLLINMLKELQKKGFSKPLLTTYAPVFTTDPDKYEGTEPTRMYFDKFTPEGIVFFLFEGIPEWKKLTEPIRSRFYSAHFAFTVGSFCKEVPHDPLLYFHGEEITIAVRAFTHGYDLFHPHKIIVWHEYTRKNRTKQWDDDTKWGERNASSLKRCRELLGVDGVEAPETVRFGKYGFGKVRSLRDYEKYAGILFSKRAIQDKTARREYPPNAETEEEWIKSFLKPFEYIITNLDLQSIKSEATDCDFWVIAFHGKDNTTLHREDLPESEINTIMNSGMVRIRRSFHISHNNPPVGYIVWPHSKSKGWCKKITASLLTSP